MEKENKKPKRYQNQFIFEYLKNILLEKSVEKYESHISSPDFNSFPNLVILRYLSMCRDKRVRDMVVRNQILIERLDKISHSCSYRWYIDNIPQQSSGFIKYIK